jgi:hypothetical protein
MWPRRQRNPLYLGIFYKISAILVTLVYVRSSHPAFLSKRSFHIFVQRVQYGCLHQGDQIGRIFALGWLFTLGSFLMREGAHILGYFIPRLIHIMHSFWQKNALGYISGASVWNSSGHPGLQTQVRWLLTAIFVPRSQSNDFWVYNHHASVVVLMLELFLNGLKTR